MVILPWTDDDASEIQASAWKITLDLLQTRVSSTPGALDLSRRLREEIEALERAQVARLYEALEAMKIATEALREDRVLYANMNERVKQQKERDRANLQNLTDECATLKETLRRSEDQREQLQLALQRKG